MSGTLHYTSTRLRRLAVQFRHLPGALALVWQAAPQWTIGWLLLLVVQGLLPVASVYLVRAVVNSLLAAIRSGGTWDTALPALSLAAAFAGVMLVLEVMRILSTWVRTALAEHAQDHISAQIQAKSVAIDLAFYDTPDFYDHLHRARAEASYRPAMLVDSIGGLLQNGITLVAMAAVLIPFGPLLPLALLISTAPALYVVLRASNRRHEFNLRTTNQERQSWYYDSLMTTGTNAAEIRLFALGDYFRAGYDRLRRGLRRERLDLGRRHGLEEIAATIIGFLVTGAAMLAMTWRAMRGVITLGDLALFYQALNQGLGLAHTLLANVGQLYENSLFLGNLFAFLALKSRVCDPVRPRMLPLPLVQGIRFRDVVFSYPGSDTPALRGFDLSVCPDETIALVGPNGAGKSTLVKLLCRFYDPDAGAIEINGVDVREIPMADLRRAITVAFQQPVHYDATVAENIAYGKLDEPDAALIRAAARQVGADDIVARLPHGLEAHLGKYFIDGAELSMGEWQRIGLARAYFRGASIVVLDEPTSAMDPWAEIEWGERFREFAVGRIGILITHRFTTAMFANVIHVMDGGRIVESGTHASLLRAGGLYARGWAAQARV